MINPESSKEFENDSHLKEVINKINDSNFKGIINLVKPKNCEHFIIKNVFKNVLT